MAEEKKLPKGQKKGGRSGFRGRSGLTEEQKRELELGRKIYSSERTGRTGLTKKGKQKIEQVGRGALEGAQSIASFLPNLGRTAGLRRAKALAKKEAKKKDDMRWKTGTKSETVELKRGGTVRGAGLAQRGVHKVKHF